MDEGRRVKLLESKSNTTTTTFMKKVQVVYYISKVDGQLEHPHILEVSHSLHHHLRLKDVLDRLSVLRGRGMPSLYSWSCKRMYKNGYVWNDLGENDVIFTSEEHEYVLKASQLVSPSPPDKQQGQVDEPQMGVPKQRKQQIMTPKRHIQFNEEELELEEKRINTNTASSGGGLRLLSPPASTGESKRFDPYPTLSRNSVLLSLMSCGGSMGKSDHDQPAAARKSCSSSSGGSSWRKCMKATGAEAEAVVEDEICCMSENPRFGKTPADEREYFSGSIVETMTTEERLQVEPIFNKSSSYKEERGSKTSIPIVAQEDDEIKRGKRVGGKCIPKRFF